MRLPSWNVFARVSRAKKGSKNFLFFYNIAFTQVDNPPGASSHRRKLPATAGAG